MHPWVRDDRPRKRSWLSCGRDKWGIYASWGRLTLRGPHDDAMGCRLVFAVYRRLPDASVGA